MLKYDNSIVAETLGMESNATLERRGSIFFSANSDVVDSADNKGDKSPKVVTPEKRTELPVLSVPRHRTQSESQQYADTEVESCSNYIFLIFDTI